MPVPYAFSAATSAIPLSQLDANFNTTITLGNTAIQLGNTVTTLNNMTLANVTISSGNVTLTNVTVTTANVTTANITTAIIGTANVTTANVATSIVTTSETLSYGTVNGVAYLNGSKVLTTGSALTFDGTTLTSTTSASTAGNFKATSSTAQVINVTASNDVNTTVGLLVLGSAAGSLGMLGAGAPALYTAATELNLMANNASGVIKFAAGGTSEQMRLTSTGLGIGTSSPTQKLTLVNNAASTFLNTTDNTVNTIYGTSTGLSAGLLGTLTNHPLVFYANNNERARIDSSGNLLVGKTANDTTSPGTAVAKFSANVGGIRNVKTATGTYESLQNYHNGTYVGGITYSDTATALATSSDARLKKNIVAAESAKNLIDSISVKAFDWKVNDEHQRYGFIAQELLTVFPESVIKGSDEQETLAVDNARFIPVLVKAIQELKAEVDSLKAQLKGA